MTTILWTIAGILLLLLYLVDCWFSYIAVMTLRRHKGQLGRFARVVATVGVAWAYVKDATLVLIFGAILLTLPREFTLTAMLKRLQLEGGWRGERARWICDRLLNQFDPYGPHC